MAPHMMEWNKPTATKSHGWFQMMAAKSISVAMMVVKVSCTRGGMWLSALPHMRPTSISPQ